MAIYTTTLGDLCELDDGINAGPSWSRLKNATTDIAGVPVVKPAALTADGRILRDDLERFPADDALNLDRFRLRRGDLVTVRQGKLGRTAVVGFAEHGWLFGPACIRLRLREDAPILPDYLAHYLARDETRAWLYAQASGATVLTLTGRRLASLPVLVPSMSAQRQLLDEVAEVDAQVRRHEQALGLLAELRASLIERTVTPRP